MKNPSMMDLFRTRLLDPPVNGAAPNHPAPVSDYDMDPGAREALPLNRPLRSAAVLVPIIQRPDPTVLLTQRADHLNHHAGQVSFPGGRVEEADTGPVDTALRETEEEVGLSRSFVDVVGALDTYETGTGFSITPIVGFVRTGFDLVLQEEEVAEAFEVPLDFILDQNNHQLNSGEWKGRVRHYHVIPYRDYHIWGATAGMLVNLHNKLKG